MKNYFYIVSLRYAPGNWQHMQSFADRLLSQGYPVRFLMSSGYSWMNGDYRNITNYSPVSNSVSEMLRSVLLFFVNDRRSYYVLFKNYSPSGLLLVMWHPLNFLLARMVKSLYPDVPVMPGWSNPFIRMCQ